MINRIPGIGAISRILHTRGAHQEARTAMTRVISQLELAAMPYESGLSEERRMAVPFHSAMGVWLLELPEEFDDAELLMQNVIPAVAADLRSDGLGLLLTQPLAAEHILVAIADTEEVWKFFVTTVVHQSPRPGGWLQIGLKLERMARLNALQMNLFLSRTTPEKVQFEDSASV
jgi:hypothetical protein